MVVVRLGVHERGEAPWAVGPADTRAVAQSRIVRDALSFVQTAGRIGRIEHILDECAIDRLLLLMQVVGSGNADVERADIAPIPVVAALEIDAVELDEALVERAAVVDPVDQRLGLRIDRRTRVGKQAGNRVLERLTGCRQEIVRAGRRARKRRIVGEVGRHQEGEVELRIVERGRDGVAEAAQHAGDLDDVVGRLEVQAGEEIPGRRVVEADAPVGGQFRRQPRSSFHPSPPPVLIASAPPEPPFIEIPPGSDNEETQAVALPGVPSPAELWTFQAPDPTGGSVCPTVQLVRIGAVWAARVPTFWPAIATLASGESSPNTGARNDVPHVPRMVKRIDRRPVECHLRIVRCPERRCTGRDATRIPDRRGGRMGMAFWSLNTGMLTWVNTAQTWRPCASC